MNIFLFLLLLLLPGGLLTAQDAYVPLEQRLKGNLFLDVYLNKSECYVGESIIATYKLYSSLESESEIVKNPSFPGFSVRDLVSRRDGAVARETIDGVKFDVHLLRKIQLTPLQSGTLQLDPLVMENRIRLVDAAGNRSPLLEEVTESYPLQNGYYNLTISSVPISVNVLNRPDTARTSTYNGVVGNFRMNIQLSKDRLAPGEQGLLTITIVGNGNFDQVKPPLIEWPAGISSLAAKTVAHFPKGQKEGNGYVAFGIPFSGTMPGSYTIMPIRFSYFDAAANRYNTITNRPISFYIIGERNTTGGTAKNVLSDDQTRKALVVGAAVLGALLLLLLLIRKRKHRAARRMIPHTEKESRIQVPAADHISKLLQPAAQSLQEGSSQFYHQLKQGVIRFFEEKYELPPALFNRSSLQSSMTEKGVDENRQNEILSLLTEIEMNIYSGVGLHSDKTALLQKTRAVLGKF